jgi:murein DD-endopeptidase MepM/ murein hydrolase activator NlpD
LTLIVLALIAFAAWWLWKEGKLGSVPGLPPPPVIVEPAPPTEEPAPPAEEPAEEPSEEPAEEPSEPPAPEEEFFVDAQGRTFSYHPAGDLVPGSAPSNIIVDTTVYDSDIAFPFEEAAFVNSQVYGAGGSQAALNGKGTNQCDAANYNYPWRENFCEKRGKNQYFCAQGGHTGVDIRPATCQKEKHWVIAPEAGVISYIGSYGVQLLADDGTWYQMLHMDMANLAVKEGDRVAPKQRIGKVSNVFFDKNGAAVPTTIHMHLDMKESYAPTNGDAPFVDRVNPYMTLVAAYERKLAAER